MDPSPAFPRRTGTAEVSVRPARPDDAAAIARVQELTWRTAYRDLLPAAVLDSWEATAAEATWRAAVVSPPTPGHGVLVALERQTVVGFAAYGPAELGAGERPSAEGPTTEVAALLVEPRWGRRGHGSRLLAAVSDLAAATGAGRLQMWLPEQDAVSAGFLESAGWDRDGWARTLDTGDVPLREVRWHTVLGSGSAVEEGGA
ncbi:GNAT family N-acetyltransferase [Geodermatophilus sp. YIM 151500]|uniref:GNAT family N-acetyltransferase n=1 Tax=Geodermatophilus sp. YIM 151500 TaxID=2984531 RepID=UPI0021E44D62|nr:GNAT family N-acetyltransferase [Geodermatophilus sp. YIM 151500]MCV2488442.1 GNAT family N-acetyltransferase [Geodermatophilus sp. YIM 151500]